jgi:hypothetical protein
MTGLAKREVVQVQAEREQLMGGGRLGQKRAGSTGTGLDRLLVRRHIMESPSPGYILIRTWVILPLATIAVVSVCCVTIESSGGHMLVSLCLPLTIFKMKLFLSRYVVNNIIPWRQYCS